MMEKCVLQPLGWYEWGVLVVFCFVAILFLYCIYSFFKIVFYNRERSVENGKERRDKQSS